MITHKKPTVLPRPKDLNINIKEDKDLTVSLMDDLIKNNVNEKEADMNSEEIKSIDLFSVGKQVYKDFEERAKNKGRGYSSPNYPAIENALEGWDTGLYLFAGESNSGKSAAMMNIMKDLCSHEDNLLFGIYYALDDSKFEIIPRVIAMEQSIPIGVVSKPNRYQEIIDEATTVDENITLIQEQLRKREIGLRKLESEVNKFLIQDAEKITNSSDIANHIEAAKTFLKSYYLEQGESEKAAKVNVIIAIDALNDIKLDPKVYGRKGKDEASEEIAKFAKDLSTKYDIIVLASAHLRKLNGNRRPMLDDLRDANTLIFEASVVWLVYNDVSKNKQGAKIFWNDGGNPAPVLEMDWAKNKKSSYKGRTFNLFRPNWSQIKECSKKTMEGYETLITQS